MPASDPDVTVCITAYKSGRMIEPTLRSVRAQTYRNFRALISIDGPDPETEAACRALGDDRFEVIVQRNRLGWVGNSNALLDRVSTPFFFFLPHDDLLDLSYIEALRRELIADPGAVNAYCDVELFGAGSETRRLAGLDGELFSRVSALLSAPLQQWIPWRGLTRSSVLAGGLRMRDNAYNGYNSHVNFVLALLCLGRCRRIPETFYRHRDRSDEVSVRTGWRSRPVEERYAAAVEHALHCMDTVASVGVDGESGLAERPALLQLLLLQLVTHGASDRSFASADFSALDRCLAVAGDLAARMHGLPLGTHQQNQAARGSGSKRLTAKLRVIDAERAIAQKDFSAAEAAIAAALALDPRNGKAHWKNAILLRRRKRLAEALASIRKAQSLLPSNARLQLALADLLARNGDLDGAIAAAEAATARRPDLAQAHCALARYLANAGRHSTAPARRASNAS